MRCLICLILSAALALATGCTEDNPGQGGGWDVGNSDVSNDSSTDTGESDGAVDTGDPDADGGTQPDADGGTQPDADADADTGMCGTANQVCEWDCAEQDPDCDQCPDKSEFTTGPWEPESCMLIDFACSEGTEHYSDETCGCGCLPAQTDPCAAQDARGQGACDAIVGIVWDGDSCEYISGCSCEGSDCGDVFDSMESCEQSYAQCESQECAAMDTQPVGPCDAVLGWTWDGDQCTAISGCECEGADCQDLYSSQRECQRDRIKCGSSAFCGGFGGIQCPDDMFCDYRNDICGAADGGGECKDRPQACSYEVDEVCGCDGQVYTNECFANEAGVDIQEDMDSCQP